MPPKFLRGHKKRKEKRKYVARPGIEARTPDLRVRSPTDCATRPGVFDVITKLRHLSISEELVTKLTENYGKIKDQLLVWQLGYSILLNENLDLFERSMR